MTKVPGGSSALKEPQADTETRSVTPTCFSRIDVGAIVDPLRRQAMPAPVPRQEHGLGAADAAEAQAVGRLAPRRRDALLALVLETGQVVDAGSTDDADKGFGHEGSRAGPRMGTLLAIL